MANVININKNQLPENEDFIYTVDDSGLFGVKTIDGELAIYDEGGVFTIEVSGKKIGMSRKMLAEFLWVSTVLIDSEERYMPDGAELVAIRY